MMDGYIIVYSKLKWFMDYQNWLFIHLNYLLYTSDTAPNTDIDTSKLKDKVRHCKYAAEHVC